MSFAFTGIITDAQAIELSIVKFRFAFTACTRPQDLIIAEGGEDYDALVAYARVISGKILGRSFAVIDYRTWAGPVDFCQGCVLRNGVIVPGSSHAGDDQQGEEALMRVMLEFGIVIPESGYFEPFDRSQRG